MTKADRIQRARVAGATKSPAKAAAARRNGKLGGAKGGRPGNPEIKRIMLERGVTRQRAHQILRSVY